MTNAGQQPGVGHCSSPWGQGRSQLSGLWLGAWGHLAIGLPLPKWGVGHCAVPRSAQAEGWWVPPFPDTPSTPHVPVGILLSIL